jgi:predicted NAD-dependent protein-ADP-ribosyltransferase YbiA (DUF1768 family)
MKAIYFSKSNQENGWLSPFSPYYTSYKDINGRLYDIWSNVVYRVPFCNIKCGRYRNTMSQLNDTQKINILRQLVANIVASHDFIRELLLETNNSQLIYSVSKYSNRDFKWLGYDFEKGVGDNNLGEAWMYIRNTIK